MDFVKCRTGRVCERLYFREVFFDLCFNLVDFPVLIRYLSLVFHHFCTELFCLCFGCQKQDALLNDLNLMSEAFWVQSEHLELQGLELLFTREGSGHCLVPPVDIALVHGVFHRFKLGLKLVKTSQEGGLGYTGIVLVFFEHQI